MLKDWIKIVDYAYAAEKRFSKYILIDMAEKYAG